MYKTNLIILTIFFFIISFIKTTNLNATQFKHGISIFNDLKYHKNFQHFDYINPHAIKGGKIKYGVEGTFNNLNPFILKGIPVDGINMTFDSLMESSADEISSKYGLIAQSVKLADNKKSITFKLRKIAKFHDGSKINANDVIFSFNTLKEKGHPSYNIIYRNIIEAQKINDYEVKFIFNNIKNQKLPLAIASLPIFSKKYYNNHQFNKTTFKPPLGSGPYKILKVDAGKSITFQRVKNYWAKDLPVNIGRYNFDEITYDYYRDNNVLVEAFKSGAYDFRQENIARNWANSYNIDKVKNGQIIKKEIKHKLPSSMQAFVFNLRKEKFQDRNLREAIALAFDFEWVKEKIFYGSYLRTNSFFSNSEFASYGLPDEEELKILNKFKNDIPSQIFNTPFILPKTNGTGFNRKNLLKAKKILKNSKYCIKNQKLINSENQKPIEFEFLIDSKSFQMVIAPMVKNLAILGIKAKIRLVDKNQYQNRLKNYDYDIIINVFGNGMIPGDEQFSYWHSSQKDIVGGYNMAGVDNKAIDYLVTKISNNKNKKELKILTKSLDRILLWNFYVIPQWHSQNHRILYQNKFSIPEKIPDYSLALDSWWIE